MTIRHALFASLAFVAALSTGAALAQAPAVKAEGVWARATVQGQKASGAFMKLTAPEAMELVGVSSPVAGVTEIHEMKMEGDIMRMRAIAGLKLPAGQTVELKPGGYHVMLMDLRQPLMPQSNIPLVLEFKDARGVSSRLELSVPVSAQPPAGAPAGGHGSHGHRH